LFFNIKPRRRKMKVTHKKPKTDLEYNNAHDWQHQDVGIISNSRQPMYVSLNDGSAVVYHDDPNAVQRETWTQWRIALQDFAQQGIDLSAVRNMAIGAGTRGDTSSAGGTGLLFFDDFRLYRPPVTVDPDTL